MYVLYRYEGNSNLHVISKLSWDGWLKRNPEEKGFFKVAEHHDRDVLVQMARLAEEGEK